MLEDRSLRRRGGWVVAVALVIAPTALMPANAQDAAVPARKVVRSQADLPRFEYSPGVTKASDLLTDNGAFTKLADQVQHHAERLLREYDIHDDTTRRAVHSALRDLALLRGDADAVRTQSRIIRQLQPDPIEQRFSGTMQESILAGFGIDDDAKRAQAVQAEFRRMLDSMPWDTMGNRTEQLRSSLGLYTPDFIKGAAQANFDPAYGKTGALGWDAATQLVFMRTWLIHLIPMREPVLAALEGYIAANKRERPEIWSARNMSLEGRDGLAPVVVGIWDSGVDPDVFKGRMWVNEQEVAGNGIDDDDNGFVDDVHGLGFGGDWGNDYDGQPLAPTDEAFVRAMPELEGMTQGFYELSSGLDTPAAREVQARVAKAKPEEVGALMESQQRYMYYAHGTHVAGIALDGNPAARVLSVRNDSPWQTVPPPFTRVDADAMARTNRQAVDYFKAHGVRVVNMSWAWTPKDFEQTLEANGVGKDAAERAALAAVMFRTVADALREAMVGAPDILFVPGAGNSRDDATFTESIPSGIDLPNVLTAGAVDRAGDMAGFTTTGPTVRIYTNGVAVDSFVPGGKRIPMSGTSMSAPQATNLAAKLFALDPDLTPAEVVDLILKGATKSDDGKRLLINPKASVALLEGMRD